MADEIEKQFLKQFFGANFGDQYRSTGELFNHLNCILAQMVEDGEIERNPYATDQYRAGRFGSEDDEEMKKQFPVAFQERRGELSDKKTLSTITEDESAELDRIEAVFDAYEDWLKAPVIEQLSG